MSKSFTFDAVAERLTLYHVFQPIVDLNTGKIFAYEALTRSKGQFQFPQELFRAAYEEGYVISLDLHCIHNALHGLHQIKKEAFLFINVEPMTLAHAFRKGKEAEALLRYYRKFSRRVVFELTEGMKARDFPLVRRGARLLQAYGFQFAVDDVAGIGLKLLNLGSLKPAYLKLDRQLIDGISHNRMQQELLRYLSEIARTYKARLIAEGIERKDDYDFIRQVGIPYAQGYYLAKPQRVIYTKLNRYPTCR